MSAIIRAVAIALLGVLLMPDTLDAQEKRERQNPKSYDEPVTVRQKIGTKFLKPVENVPAFRGEIKGKVVFFTRPLADNSESPKGSEITDKDGAVWVVTDVTKASTYHINYVEKKPAEKKP